MTQALQAKVMQMHNEVIAIACKRFPQFSRCPTMTVKFFDTGRAAGKCIGSRVIMYNTTVFGQSSDEFIRDTVAHEIAHAVANFTGLGRHHDKGWQMICRALGGDGKRCYDGANIEFKMARNRKTYKYRATCGTELNLSDVMHNRLQRVGGTRILRRTGGKITRDCYIG